MNHDARVLVVLRNLTTATRLLDVMPIFADDHRVERTFTIVPGSAFEDGTLDVLHALDARHIAWDDVPRTDVRLALAAGSNGPLDAIAAPLLVVPHGAGFNKLLPTGHRDLDRDRDRDRAERTTHTHPVSGLSRAQLMRGERVVATRIGLSHERQRTRLATHCPPALAHAEVIGDPCLDRLAASASWRDRYRRALGVRPDQRLIVVSSTWEPTALDGAWPDLPNRLLAELPYDEYRVAIVLHPNQWSRHGAYGIGERLGAARHGGLLTIPPHEGWRAALVAADLLIGDHGSVALYAAAIGVPVAFGAYDARLIAPDSPMAELADTADHLTPHRGLRDQIDKAVRPAAAQLSVARGTFGLVGESLTHLRRVAYDLMGLSLPTTRMATHAVPVPVPTTSPVHAFRVRTELTEDAVRITRHPAAVEDPFEPADSPLTGRHLAVDENDPDTGRVDGASVLFTRDPAAGPHWIDTTVLRPTGPRLAAQIVDARTCRIGLRDGTRLRSTAAADPTAGDPLDPAVHASAVYALLVARRPLTGTVHVTCGTTTATLSIEPA
ncbi:hypothetical protein [Embleya sp. NBC_00896]|uniref:hypothetical protein n=1 Tax=Embleya sp. NBC_00896 TaxID=2975961 RepID=UPI00386881A8|nr:hypothetical protein OG928_07775 [Embleya sp. NBC_00896]